MQEKTKETLIQEEITSTETGQSEEKQETAEELKERLAKVEEERENYKKMALKYKSETKTLDAEEEYPNWDDASKKFQKQTIELAQKQAEEVTMRQVEKVNEKNAISAFIEKNPELADNKEWTKVIKNYQPRSKESVQDIIKDLNRAYVLTQFDEGVLGKKEDKKADISELTTVGKTTSKSATEGKTLTQNELRLAKAMKVDPEKLANEDLSKPATIEIN
jgi:hypothetical protein